MKLKKKSFLTAALAVTVTIFFSAIILTDAKTMDNKVSSQTSAEVSKRNGQWSMTRTTKSGNEYTNFKLGFRLNLPLTWSGNYIIQEYQDYISVNFTGKSKKSKGLNMFFIGTKKAMDKYRFYDSPKKLGTINKMDYYYYTRTDSPIGILFDAQTEKNIKERELMKADFKKAREMEKNIPALLKTFRAIK